MNHERAIAESVALTTQETLGLLWVDFLAIKSVYWVNKDGEWHQFPIYPLSLGRKVKAQLDRVANLTG